MQTPTSRLFDVIPRNGIFRALFVWLALVLLAPGLRAEGMAADEKARVDGMISHLEGLKDAVFIRNGTEYDAKTAAKFLRGKWESNAGKIKTAEDFIRVAATKSSTTGKPYMIRLKGAKATPCADYLTNLLAQEKP
jgi:hypothetical protein